MTKRALPIVLLGVLTLVAASCRTERPKEHYVPYSAAAGGASSSGSGGLGTSSGASANSGSGAAFGFGGLGGAGWSTGGFGPIGSGGRRSTGSDVTASGGTAPTYDCDAPAGATPAFSRRTLRAAAAECVQHAYCRFEGAATQLASGAEEFQSEPTGEHSAAVRSAWLETLREWSVLEVMQFGPAATAAPTAGKDVYQGQSIRDLIYSWPQVSRCRVDEQVALQKYLTLGVDKALISARGLPGIETLLFYEGLDTECGQNTTTFDTWSTLDAATIAERRRDYAVALADDVLDKARGLVESWSPDGGDFQETFVSASGYPDEQEAMNVLGWSLLYIEREVKDWKLGVPAGYTVGAPVTSAEAPFADEQSALLVPNLQGFRRLFQGCGPDYSGLGFDDWLADAGHHELADDIIEASVAAEAALAALPRFSQATIPELQSTYATVKVLTDLLKADLFGTGSVLNLKLPASLEGDTD